jgi:hypothetical protein
MVTEMFKTRAEIVEFLKSNNYKKTQYKIHEDLSVELFKEGMFVPNKDIKIIPLIRDVREIQEDTFIRNWYTGSNGHTNHEFMTNEVIETLRNQFKNDVAKISEYLDNPSKVISNEIYLDFGSKHCHIKGYYYYLGLENDRPLIEGKVELYVREERMLNCHFMYGYDQYSEQKKYTVEYPYYTIQELLNVVKVVLYMERKLNNIDFF